METSPDPAHCVVLVPVATYVEPECARGLVALAKRGYQLRQVTGITAIDQGRSQMATEALADGFDEIMWIDSDIGFEADAVELLRSHRLPMVCGIYPKKSQRALSCHLLPETEQVVFGNGGGLLEILYAAAGFLLTHRTVYETIAKHEALPVCNTRFGRPIVPYFLPSVIPDSGGHWYLGEDFAFSERARRSGFSVMADTRIRLNHVGRWGFTWEDAGSDRPRYTTYNFDVER